MSLYDFHCHTCLKKFTHCCTVFSYYWGKRLILQPKGPRAPPLSSKFCGEEGNHGDQVAIGEKLVFIQGKSQDSNIAYWSKSITWVTTRVSPWELCFFIIYLFEVDLEAAVGTLCPSMQYGSECFSALFLESRSFHNVFDFFNSSMVVCYCSLLKFICKAHCCRWQLIL